ncbi:hypothetical protein [Nocardia implantans]|uniref:Uncharacterized protein n=1 Tax=Nocardia implantans TaxID=3108168 RepID=A0ABU6AW42_9NOCA|nr:MULTISPECIES: hypothetical protein [unclassified Nocardia]MBF6192919.1 hypothetical protein [Nocardia beijingensis]MEA3531363.1 hypothetical protein [Nocardia sp. CDC192]MEB3511710.1 hypothetical protein [Nocardia sp. CDC186]
MTTPGAVPPPGADPLDPTVLELLRGSALAPMLDLPVNDVLRSMGLPNLPELPAFVHLPELPPLPTIDLGALMRPLTDLASAFGTGQLAAPAPAQAGAPAAGQAPPVDPTQLLQNVSTVMQTVMQVGSSLVQTLMSVWQGMAAMEAAKKAGEAQTDAGELAAQSTQEKAVLGNAAGSVFTGAGLMAAVLAKFSTTMAFAPLLAASPGGQGFLVASAIEATTEALAITAKTKAELVGHSASMTQAGQKVPITNAPTGVKSAEQLTQLMSMITPLISTAGQVAQSLGQLAAANPSLLAPKSISAPGAHEAEDAPGEGKEGEHAGGAGGAGGIGGGFPGAIAAAAAPLNPWPGTRVAGGSLGNIGAATAAGTGAGTSSATVAGTTAAGTGTGTGYVPMGGAGMASAGLARDGESTTDALRGQMVTGQHGDEVVGRIEGVSLPVVGAADTTSEPPPDKELTL